MCQVNILVGYLQSVKAVELHHVTVVDWHPKTVCTP